MSMTNVGRGQEKMMTMDDALAYAKTVRDTFHDKKDKYEEFLEVLKDFKAKRIDNVGVVSRVKELFKGHRDLILGFSTFLPKGYKITLPPEDELPCEKKPVEFEEAINFVNKIKTRFPSTPGGQEKMLTTDDALAYAKTVRDTLHERKDKYEEFLDILKNFKSQRIDNSGVVSRVKELFKGHHDLILGFSSFLPKGYKITLLPEGELPCEKNPVEFEEATNFVNKIKTRFLSTPCCNDAPASASPIAPGFKAFAGALYQAPQNTMADIKKDVGLILRDEPDLAADFRRFLPSDSSVNHCHALKFKIKLRQRKRVAVSHTVSELDLSSAPCCTPSYRLLPEKYQSPPLSERTELDKSVLNDEWVSIAPAIPEYSSKRMRKNKHEEILFRCEDDRFELDLLLERVKSTSERVEEVLEKMRNSTINLKDPFIIEDHFSAQNIRCIEQLYGDHGLDMMDVLRKNAGLALPVILTRLKQKQEEWSRCRNNFNEVWAEIYAKNYHKSLDHHRSSHVSEDRINC